MKKHRFIAWGLLFTALAGLTLAARAQSQPWNQWGDVWASAFSHWSVTSVTPVPSAGVYTLQISADSPPVLLGGPSIQPLNTNAPLLIDSGANQEVATPSAVACSWAPQACTITIRLNRAHRAPFTLVSASAGLQEALNFEARQGGIVRLDPGWTGTSAMIAAAMGSANTVIEDQRQGRVAWYTWSDDGYDLQTTTGIGKPGSLANPANAPLFRCDNSGGSVAAGTYRVEISYADFAGETLPSPPSSAVTCKGGASMLLVAANPSDTFTGGEEGMYLYIQTGGIGNYYLANERLYDNTAAQQIGNDLPEATAGDAISPGSQSVTPEATVTGADPMTGFAPTAYVIVSPGQSDEEIVQVGAVSATTFTAAFAQAHSSGVVLQPVGYLQTAAVPTSGPTPNSANTAVISALQAAYNALPPAGPGGVLYIPSGNFMLDSALVLWHSHSTVQCAPGATLQADGRYEDDVVRAAAYAYPAQGGFLTDIAVRGCTINGNQTSLTHVPVDTFGNGIDLNYAANSNATENTIENIAYQGILAEGGSNANQITNDHLDRNTITQFGELGCGLEGGVWHSSCNFNTILDPLGGNAAAGVVVNGGGLWNVYNSVIGNRIAGLNYDNTGGVGIRIQDGASYTTISGNSVDSSYYGIAVEQFVDATPSYETITDNTVNKSYSWGLILTCSALDQGFDTVSGNTLIGNGDAVGTTCNSSSFTGNTIGGSTADGIQANGEFNVWSGNSSTGNAGYGLNQTGGSYQTVVGNDFDGNTAGAMTALDSTSFAGGNRLDNTSTWYASGKELQISPTQGEGLLITGTAAHGAYATFDQTGAGSWSVGMLTPGSPAWSWSEGGATKATLDASGDFSAATGRFSGAVALDGGTVLAANQTFTNAGTLGGPGNFNLAAGSLAEPASYAVGGAMVQNPTASGTLALAGSCPSDQFVTAVSGAAVPACAQPSASALSNGSTGSGAVVLANSPTLVNPALGHANAASLTLGTDAALSSAPRMLFSAFVPVLTALTTIAIWIPDRGITITRIEAQTQAAPAACGVNAVVQLSDGTTSLSLPIAAAADDSGALSQNFGAGASLSLSLSSAASGCSSVPSNLNVLVQYRMQ